MKIKKLKSSWFKLSLFLIFLTFAFLHFYRLNSQEFVGDEASPILLIDKAWDFIKTRDVKLLAFPFIWYHEPFRAVFSGSLIHLVGVNKIFLRLPGILFSLSTYWLLVWIFIKEKFPELLTVLSLFTFSSLAVLMDYRLASGDSRAVFLILFTAYLIYQSLINKNSKILNNALWLFLFAFLTMLDSVILIIPLALAVYFSQALKSKSFKKTLFKVSSIITIYLILWSVLPFLAYKLDFQPWYENRGFFYYLSRIGEGTAADPWLGFKALLHYSSHPFVIWLIISFIFSWFSKPLRLLSWIITPAWLAILLLNRSSSHVLIYLGIFFLQAVMFTRFLWEKYKKTRIIIFISLLLITFFNFKHFYNHFIINPLSVSDRFILGHSDVPLPGKTLDEAVKVIYRRYP